MCSIVNRNRAWDASGNLVVDGITFLPSPPGAGRFASKPGRFCLVKPRELIDDHLALLDDLRPNTIVELGILQGGSTAMMALVARPRHLIGIEFSSTRVPALDALLEERDLASSVQVHYGVDQGDGDRLSSILDDSLADAPIDLVIDDASHAVEPTRASFNVLFPRLRPGGVFVLEDWSWAHVGYGAHRPDQVPLTTVVFELVMALPSVPGLIDEIRITREWALVVRGAKRIEPGEFELSASYSQRGRELVVPLVNSSGRKREQDC